VRALRQKKGIVEMTLQETSLVLDIDHVQIAAPKGCESDARAFFGTLLGLEEIQKPEPLRSRGGCWFWVGPRQLHIGVENGFSAATKAHPAFATHDIVALSDKLEKAGLQVRWDDAVAGIRRLYVDDPWGNRIEFTEPTYSV
jgi:catechol 2,3-dioxygenase-like lactoylglutathione lyase family enzyme